MPYLYPPAAPTISGDYITVSQFLNDTPVVNYELSLLARQRFVALTVLTGRQTTDSGSLQVQGTEGIFADRAVEVVAPGAEYPLTTFTTGPLSQVSTQKWGEDTIITDEAVSRERFPAVSRAMTKLINTAAKNIDGLALSLIASSVTQTQGTAGTLNWTGTSPTILRDILTAKATLMALNRGYEPDVLLVNDLTWAAVASDPTLINTLQRESTSNVVYSGQLTSLAGVAILPTPNLPASGAWLIDSSMLGGIVTEDLGGGYQPAGDMLQSKTIREEHNDRWRMRVRATFAPYIREATAAIKIANGQ
jgi:hypothetical protein